MKIKGNEVLWLSDKGNVAITYSQFDFGVKHKVLRKVKYAMENGKHNEVWTFINAFVAYGEALSYAKKMNDCIVYR